MYQRLKITSVSNGWWRHFSPPPQLIVKDTQPINLLNYCIIHLVLYGNSCKIFTKFRTRIYTNASPDCNKGANLDLSRLWTASNSALHSTRNPLGRLLTAWSQGHLVAGLLVWHETAPAPAAVVDPRGRRLRRRYLERGKWIGQCKK